MEMGRSEQPAIPAETKLGLLAMQFRGTRDESVRDKVTADYRRVVAGLIASGQWKEMPAFEDMLPDERMPEAFFQFWSIPCPCKPKPARKSPKNRSDTK
jgi:hypothetical protein